MVSANLLLVNPIVAQSIKPSVPDFSVQLLGTPYDVPTTYSVDPYTGQTVTHEGYHVENRTIEIKILNQPVSDGYCLYYNIRVKGHFGQVWTERYSYSIVTYFDDATVKTSSQYLRIWNCPMQSNEQYTIITFPSEYDPTSVLDIQVEAILGKLTQAYELWHPQFPQYGGDYVPAVKLVDVSGWSGTYTIYLSDEQVSGSGSTNATPTPFSEFSFYWLLPLLVVIPLITFFMIKKRNSKDLYLEK
jgi:hypothetical protein